MPEVSLALPPVPDYDDVVDRNQMVILKTQGDLTVRGGDIALTRRGDLMLNDEVYHALFSFVQFWRYNYPALWTLFHTMLSAQAGALAAEANLNNLPTPVWNSSVPSPSEWPTPEFGSGLWAAVDRHELSKQAADVYASTIILVIDWALGNLCKDMEANATEWNNAGAPIGGRSLGEGLRAAGNNFRHADEWLVATSLSGRQMQSIRVLSDFLQEPVAHGGSMRPFARDRSQDVLEVICEGNFMLLEAKVFEFAHSLAVHRRARV